jgi:hypothetical protein
MKRTVITMRVNFILFVLLTSLTTGTAKHQGTSEPEIEATIQQFWKALAELDADLMKQTVDWPVALLVSGRPVVVFQNG